MKDEHYNSGFPFDWYNPNNTDWDGNPYPWWFGDKRHFRPWYDSDSDYNTNAKSYYDYLGFRQRYLQELVKKVNELFKRDVKVNSTSTIDAVKSGDWQKGDSVITLSNNVKISKAFKNAITSKDDGIYAIDYTAEIKDLENRTSALEKGLSDLTKKEASDYQDLTNKYNNLVKKEADDYNNLVKKEADDYNNLNNKYNDLNNKYNDLNNKYNNLSKDNSDLKNALNKIINRLASQGAWNGGLNGDFKDGQSLATGNINIYGIGRSNGTLIKTHDGDRDGDIIQGLD